MAREWLLGRYHSSTYLPTYLPTYLLFTTPILCLTVSASCLIWLLDLLSRYHSLSSTTYLPTYLLTYLPILLPIALLPPVIYKGTDYGTLQTSARWVFDFFVVPLGFRYLKTSKTIGFQERTWQRPSAFRQIFQIYFQIFWEPWLCMIIRYLIFW